MNTTEGTSAAAVGGSALSEGLGAWLPIETAPRDAVILLGYAPHPRMVGERRVYEGRWHEEQQTWTSVNGFLVHTGATHWQPLPAPPESA